MEGIFRNIMEISLFAIPVILFCALFSKRLGRRYGARWRYLLWLALAVRLCVPMQFSLPEGMQGMRVELPAVQTETRERLVGRTENFFGTETIEAIPVETQPAAVDRTQPPAAHLDADSSYRNPLDFLLAYPQWLWAGGVLLFLAWQAWKYAGFQRMLRRNRRKIQDAEILDIFGGLCREMGIENRPRLYFCAGLPSPLCIGFLRQAVYLNSEERELRDTRLILRHELTHCKRKDLWFQGILMLARALHFFNPFVHGMARLAARDMELSCDLAVMKNCGLQEREAYSMAILRTVQEAKTKNIEMSTAFSGGKEALQMRFENIFDRTAKKRGIALFLAAVLLICGGTAFVGCGREEAPEDLAESVVYGAYTEDLVHRLYEAKQEYIGDHVGVGKIMGLLPLPAGIMPQEEGMELFTNATPYGAKRHLQFVADEETETDDRWFVIHAMIFLALVENADYFGYDLHGENAVISKAFDLDLAKQYFGERDLKAFAADEESFRNFVLALNRYFYEGVYTPQEITDLRNLDAESAQARMNEMLSGESADRSFSYQMIYADALVHEIAAEQAGLSSNPLDYTNCEKYEELVKIGEPALRQFLMRFSEGAGGDTLEGYLMMFACQDILREGRQTDLTPTEWFAGQLASDSVFVAAFAYDAGLYTADLRENYSLGDKDAEKWSIVSAGEDARLQAVYAALQERNAAFAEDAESRRTAIFAPYIHKIVENGDEMQVFATIFEQEFVLTRTNEGDGFFDTGGSVVPTRLDFVKENGAWQLTDWITAKDGSYYMDSIKEMCAGQIGLAQKMLGDGKEHELMWQNIVYYMKANYGEMDIPFYTSSHVDEGLLKKVNQYIRLVPLYE